MRLAVLRGDRSISCTSRMRAATVLDLEDVRFLYHGGDRG
jgi:hypothetical protein